MIIYGSRATELTSESIAEKCQNCETTNSIRMKVYQNYAHVFWIPTFPIGKSAATQCSHCKQVLRKKEFPGPLRLSYEAIKSQLKTPLWTFSGLAVLFALVSWIAVSSEQNDRKNALVILSPQKGDIYEYRNEENQYTLLKVENVVADTVFLLPHLYETDRITGLKNLKDKGDEAYSQEVLLVLKGSLKTMFDDGEIINIDRKD